MPSSVRKTMIELILSTDMSIHFALADQLSECVTRVFIPLRSSRAMETVVLAERDRMTILRSLLHAADISNPAKQWEISKKWSDLVVQEFYEQGDREKAEGKNRVVYLYFAQFVPCFNESYALCKHIVVYTSSQ